MSVSLCRKGRLRSGIILVLPSALVMNHARHAQELGAELQPRALRGVDVDLEADLVRLHAEIDHPAQARESIRVSDGQDRHPAQQAQDPREIVVYRGADEEDLARLNLPDALDMPDDEGMRIDRFPLKHLLDVGAEPVASEDAQDDRRVRAREGRLRPLDESREVVEEGDLDLMLEGYWCGVLSGHLGHR